MTTNSDTPLTAYPIVSTGLGRHGHQYAHSEKFRAWIAETLEPLVEIQAVFLSLLDIDLATATGVKLDLIGRLVGAPAVIPNAVPQPFFGFNDQESAQEFGELGDDSVGGYWRELGQPSNTEMLLNAEMYRLVILAQIIKNSSLCTPPDIIRIARMIIRSDVDFAYIEHPMLILIAPMVELNQAEIALLHLMIPRPCGVGFGVVNGFFDDFGFADNQYALGFGELNDDSVGGYWSTWRDDMILFENGEY